MGNFHVNLTISERGKEVRRVCISLTKNSPHKTSPKSSYRHTFECFRGIRNNSTCSLVSRPQVYNYSLKNFNCPEKIYIFSIYALYRYFSYLYLIIICLIFFYILKLKNLHGNLHDTVYMIFASFKQFINLNIL